MNPKPCPFCGGTKILIIDGSTFRWRKAECQECQATAGEVRIEWGETALEDRIAVADKEALKVWNERAVSSNCALEPSTEPTITICRDCGGFNRESVGRWSAPERCELCKQVKPAAELNVCLIPNKNCKHCLFQHQEWKDDGFCYMFREEPTGDKCGQFKPVS